MLQKNKGRLLVLGTAIISGFSIFINKFGVSVANPYGVTFLKSATVAVLLCVAIFSMKDFQLLKSLKKKQWRFLIIVGIIGGGVPFLLFFKGLSMTSAASAAFIHKTMLIWIFILAAFFLKEKISRIHYLAGILILGGNMLLLKMSADSFGWGAVLVFLATIFWAVENVISKYLIREISPRIVMWARMLFGSIAILVFLIFSGQMPLLFQIDLQQISWILITSVLLFGYVATWYSGIKRIEVTEAAVILTLGAPITSMLNAIFLGQVSAKECISAFMVICGVVAVLVVDGIFRKTRKLERNNNSVI